MGRYTNSDAVFEAVKKKVEALLETLTKGSSEGIFSVEVKAWDVDDVDDAVMVRVTREVLNANMIERLPADALPYDPQLVAQLFLHPCETGELTPEDENKLTKELSHELLNQATRLCTKKVRSVVQSLIKDEATGHYLAAIPFLREITAGDQRFDEYTPAMWLPSWKTAAVLSFSQNCAVRTLLKIREAARVPVSVEIELIQEEFFTYSWSGCWKLVQAAPTTVVWDRKLLSDDE
jgi:hypothetical protein